jgi:hypothetical protein
MVEQEILILLKNNFEGIEVTFNEVTNTFEFIPDSASAENFMRNYSAALEGSEVELKVWITFAEAMQNLSTSIKEKIAPGYSLAVYDSDKQNTLLLIKDGYVILDYVERG